jgi:hypothetical protein
MSLHGHKVCAPMIVGQQRSGLTLLSSTGAVEGAAADRGLPIHPTTGCHKLSASEAPDPGRHHVGILGDIISECPGDFIGIRTGHVRRIEGHCYSGRMELTGEEAHVGGRVFRGPAH